MASVLPRRSCVCKTPGPVFRPGANEKYLGWVVRPAGFAFLGFRDPCRRGLRGAGLDSVLKLGPLARPTAAAGGVKKIFFFFLRRVWRNAGGSAARLACKGFARRALL